MGSDEHVQRIPCPKTMPAFDGDNPVQALYLKKRGVEKLLNKAVGKSLANSFVEEKKTNIAKESMLILRTIDGEFDPTKLETIPSFDDDNETSEQDSATTNTEASTIEFNDDYDDKCPDVSHYDSDESRSNSDDESDWSLPGIEPDAQIRYVELENSMVFVDDGHFYDDDRRDRKIVQDPRKSKMSFPQFAFCHSTELCHSEELMTTYNDMIAAVAEAKNKVEDATAKAAAEGEAEKKAEEETSAAKAEAKKKAEEKDPTLAETEAEAKMKAEEEAAVIEAKKKAEEEATAKAAAETEAKKKAEVEAAAAVAAAEAEKEAQEEAKQKAEEEASVVAEAEKKEAAAKAAAEAEAMKPKSEEQEVTEVGYTQVGILDMYMDMVRCA